MRSTSLGGATQLHTSLGVPETMSRRAPPGEWFTDKHGRRVRRFRDATGHAQSRRYCMHDQLQTDCTTCAPGKRMYRTIMKNIRKRVRLYARRRSTDNPWLMYMGCTKQFFMNYLEQQFDTDMSWETLDVNWKVNCRSTMYMDALDTRDMRHCFFHYSNMAVTRIVVKNTD